MLFSDPVPSARAMQSSVRLRHMLSALRRNCLSTLGPAGGDPLIPPAFLPPVIAAKANASLAADSKAV